MFGLTATLRSPALVCSTVLHASVLAGIVGFSTASTHPQQQVIDISVVMMSSPESQQAMAASEIPAEPINPVKANALPMNQISPPSKQAQKKVAMPAPEASWTPPTSGPQAPEATKRLAAVTEPVWGAASLHNTPPSYPDDARRKGAEGEVLLTVDVTPQGEVAIVNIARSSGYALLDMAARDAVSHWHFIPGWRDGQIIEAKVIVPVEFRLE